MATADSPYLAQALAQIAASTQQPQQPAPFASLSGDIAADQKRRALAAYMGPGGAQRQGWLGGLFNLGRTQVTPGALGDYGTSRMHISGF